LRDDMQFRTLEITSYCHPIATSDRVQTLFCFGNRIKDWSVACWKGCHAKHCYKLR